MHDNFEQIFVNEVKKAKKLLITNFRNLTVL